MSQVRDLFLFSRYKMKDFPSFVGKSGSFVVGLLGEQNWHRETKYKTSCIDIEIKLRSLSEWIKTEGLFNTRREETGGKSLLRREYNQYKQPIDGGQKKL